MTLNKEVVEKWVKALRSGEYQQSSGRLRDAHGFCCLGVLCDIAARERLGAWHEDEDFGSYEFTGTDGTSGSERETEAIRRWSGLDTTFAARLTGLNDRGKPFPEIASVIEKEAGLSA